MRGRDIGRYVSSDDSLLISIHSPHAGRDEDGEGSALHADDFNPLSPCGERLH